MSTGDDEGGSDNECLGCRRVFTSIRLWDDVGDVTVRHEGKMEDVGGAVLAGQRVEDLAVNSDLDVLPFCVAHLKHTHTRTPSL